MKPYHILKDFTGSQTGNDGPFQFTAGTVAELSDSLAEVVMKEGWAKPAAKVETAETRETKVIEPKEAKADEETNSTAKKPGKKK